MSKYNIRMKHKCDCGCIFTLDKNTFVEEDCDELEVDTYWVYGCPECSTKVRTLSND